MCRAVEELELPGVAGRDFRRFDDLQARPAVRIPDPERPAARFPAVGDDATDAPRPCLRGVAATRGDDLEELAGEEELPVGVRLVAVLGEEIVDVLHEDDVAAGRREVTEQGAVPGRAQQEPAIGGARRQARLVERQGVRRGPLLREGDLEALAGRGQIAARALRARRRTGR